MKAWQKVENYVENNPVRTVAIGLVIGLLALVLGAIPLFENYSSTVLSFLKFLISALLPRLLDPFAILIIAWTIIFLFSLLTLFVLYVLARIGLGKLEDYLFERLSDRVDMWLQERVLVIREAVLEHLNRVGNEPEQEFFWGGQICPRTGYYKTVFDREVVRMKIEEGKEFPYVLSEGKQGATTLWQFMGP